VLVGKPGKVLPQLDLRRDLRLPTRPEYRKLNQLILSAAHEDDLRNLLRAAILEDRYFLAVLLGYDTEDHPWDDFHIWWLNTRLPQIHATPGAQVLLLQPRGTYKTTCVIVDAVYCGLRWPELTQGISSWRLGVSTAILQAVRKQFERLILRWTFPDIVPVPRDTLWTERAFTLKRKSPTLDPTFLAFSLESGATGHHFDVIRPDDPVEWSNSRTDQAVQNTCQALADLPSIRSTPSAKILVSGTLWDQEDWYHKLMQNEGWTIERHPAVVEDPREYADAAKPPAVLGLKPGELLFPKAKPRERLEEDYRTYGAWAYGAQISLRITAALNAAWSTQMVRNYGTLDQLPLSWAAYHVVDLAADGSCQSWITTGLALPDKKWFIADCYGGNPTPVQLVDRLFHLVDEWGGTCIIEEIGGFAYLESTIIQEEHKRGRNLPRRIIPSRQKGKVDRIWSLDHYFRELRIITRSPEEVPPESKEFFEAHERAALRWPNTAMKDSLDTLADLIEFGVAPMAAAADPHAATKRKGSGKKKKKGLVLK
jgi:hypothetical protein